MSNAMNESMDIFPSPFVTAEQLHQLRSSLGEGRVLIMTHDNPDPDALASGKGMAYLLQSTWSLPCDLVYSGIIARAENKAVLRLLTPEWKLLQPVFDWEIYEAVLLVDSQPGSGNNALPQKVVPKAVLDHHYPARAEVDQVVYSDIRPEIGSTSSLVYQYLVSAQVNIDEKLATALFYGIQTDTRGLSRNSSPIDQEAYLALLSRIDHRLLIQIEQAGLPREYFQVFSRGLHAAEIYGQVVISYLEDMHRPDFAAELADILARLEGIRAVLCMGFHGDKLYLSLRTSLLEEDAGLLIQRIIPPQGSAGGHGLTAGGQVSCSGNEPAKLAAEIRDKLLQLLDERKEGIRLIE